MKFQKTSVKDLFVIEPEPFIDHRGYFSRVYCDNELKQIGHSKRIVNINHSKTIKKGAIRGMHFQYPPKTEIKIVKCIFGSIYDVGIDLRKNSHSYLKYHGEVLSSDNLKMLYIPDGFAHGFQALEKNTEVIYFVTEFYSPKNEGGIRYNDPKININWPLKAEDVSKKDNEWPLIDENFNPIEL